MHFLSALTLWCLRTAFVLLRVSFATLHISLSVLGKIALAFLIGAGLYALVSPGDDA